MPLAGSRYWVDLPHKQNLELVVQYPRNRPIAGTENSKYQPVESFGQLVALGFDVTVFTPAAYLRRRLQRPSMEFSSCGWLRT